MASPRDVGRRVLGGLYGRLPNSVRKHASAVIHGETVTQLRAAEGLRAVTSRVSVHGCGDQIVGGVLRPLKAVTATRFDAWAHLDVMRDAVLTALVDATIDVFELPNQPIPFLVVSSTEWDAAWRALSSSPSLSTFWVEASPGRQYCLGDDNAAPPAEALVVFQQLRAPHGELVADQRIHIRLESWTRVKETTAPRTDGGFHEVGTLLVGAGENTFASYLPPAVQEKLRVVPGQPVDWLPSIDAVTQPVDIVYTWVNGADPVWLRKKAEHVGGGTTTADAQIAARFESRDELRYSLRSVEMYASWYNHIYLVTDGHVPSWLDTDHPDLTVIDHRDLFGEEELPVFNSHAIESRLHHIKGISELFVYMNDDFFLGRPVRPELFFTGAGQAKYFKSKAHIGPSVTQEKDISVTAAAKNNRTLLERNFGRTFSSKLKHTPYAHARSLLFEMEEVFPEVFQSNVSARFRTLSDHSILSSLAQHYGTVKGRYLEGSIHYNYVDLSRPDLVTVLNRWLRSRVFDTFCMNDTGIHETDSDATDESIFDFLSSYYPVPSSLEIS